MVAIGAPEDIPSNMPSSRAARIVLLPLVPHYSGSQSKASECGNIPEHLYPLARSLRHTEKERQEPQCLFQYNEIRRISNGDAQTNDKAKIGTYDEQMSCDSSLSPRLMAPSYMRVTHDSTLTPEGVSLGAVADIWLGGGLKAGRLHELYAAQPEDGICAVGLALLLAQLQCRAQHKPLIWVREERGISQIGLPYGPGLIELGLDPATITLLMLPDARAVLRAGLDSLRAGVAAAVLIELAGKQRLLDLTATRRFALAAADSGAMALMARIGADPAPSAAHSRWQVATASSQALEANAPGRAAFALHLLRHRGGRDGLRLILEWDRDTGSFQQRSDHIGGATLSRALSAMAGSGACDTQRHRAA